MTRFGFAVWCVLFAAIGNVSAQAPGDLAKTIDRLIEAKWVDAEAQPTAPIDDADFLRRLSLDLQGRVPRVSEVRAFLDDPASDKRQRMVEKMLAGSGYVVNMGRFWTGALIPANNNQIFQFENPAFKSWIEQKVREEVAYDKIVREILAGAIGNQPNFQGFVQQPVGNGNIGTQTFFQAVENKPENAAAAASRHFLGVRLECAQCHDHPFSTWSREQFWQTAAFFVRIQQNNVRILNGKAVQTPPKNKAREIRIPNTSQTVSAKFMNGVEPDWKDDSDPRAVFADWVVAKENPYFARMAVNRLWTHFFGLGLMEPFDDEPTDENPISHPELLDELTRQFIASGYDVKNLIRAFVATKTYQRGSTLTHPSQADARLWARMPVRGMSGDQLYDSLGIAIGMRTTNRPNVQQQFGVTGSRFDFVNKFAAQDKQTEKQTSILQALMMMNGKFVADATNLSSGNTLAAIADAGFMSLGQKIETLYLATLGRMPRPEEMERMESYLARGGARNDPATALADIFWALLNSSEFALNR